MAGYIDSTQEIRVFHDPSRSPAYPQIPGQFIILIDVKKAKAFLLLHETNFYTTSYLTSQSNLNVSQPIQDLGIISSNSGWPVGYYLNEFTFKFGSIGECSFEGDDSYRFIVFKLLFEARGEAVSSQKMVNYINAVKRNRKQATAAGIARIISGIRTRFKGIPSNSEPTINLDNFIKIIGVGSRSSPSAFKIKVVTISDP
ncbi:MAG: hypothetical protein M3R00_07690 [Pseudomonadota bacterium]|nr:hypothetical protein [Pseudomonadota bacterium]